MADTSDDAVWSSLGAQPSAGADGGKSATTPAPAATSNDDAVWSTLGTGQTTQTTKQDGAASQPPPSYNIFHPDPSGAQHAFETSFGQGFRNVLNAPADWINRATGWTPYQFTMPLSPAEQQGQQQHPIASGAGRFTGEILASAPVALAGGEALPAMEGIGAAAPIVRGAIMGASQGALTSAGSPDQPIWQQVGIGAGTGAVGGWVGGKIGRMFGSDATVASQAVQDAGNTVKAAGIDVLPANLPQAGATAAQKGAAASPSQAQQINRAFGNIVGGNVDDFSATNLKPLTNTVGGQISTAANQGQIQMTPQLESDLQTVLQNAHAPGIDPLVTAKIEHEVDKVLSIAPNVGDTVTGIQFDRLVGNGSKLSGYVGDNNKDLSDLAHQLDGTLDSAFQASSKPGVYDQYIDAKTRFRLLKAIEDNVEADPSGNIKPGTIMADINRRFPNMPTQTGPGTVGQASDLARAVTTLFGGSQRASGEAAVGSWLSQHPLLAAGGAGATYHAITNPEAIGNALNWVVANPTAATAAAAYAGADRLLRNRAAAYVSSPSFANTLLRRGTQQEANPLSAYLGAGAAALPPDRPRQ